MSAIRPMPPRKASPTDLQTFRDASLPAAARAIALNRLAAEPRLELEREIAVLLDHEYSILRAEALTCLVACFQLEAHVPAALAALVEDEDWLCRSNAASALARYAMGLAPASSERTAILRALARTLRTELHSEVQEAAYDGLLQMLSRPADEFFQAARSFDVERDVDWALVTPYLTPRPA